MFKIFKSFDKVKMTNKQKKIAQKQFCSRIWICKKTSRSQSCKPNFIKIIVSYKLKIITVKIKTLKRKLNDK